MLEKNIQSKIIKKLEADGWIALKIIKLSKSGYPDILALKDGKAIFVEIKQPKGVLSPIQSHVIETLRTNGFEVNIWTKYQENY